MFYIDAVYIYIGVYINKLNKFLGLKDVDGLVTSDPQKQFELRRHSSPAAEAKSRRKFSHRSHKNGNAIVKCLFVFSLSCKERRETEHVNASATEIRKNDIHQSSPI